MPKTLGDAIDQIVTIPMRIGTDSLDKEIVLQLYEKARERQGNLSLTMQAARKLTEYVSAKDWVFLITGIGEAPWFPAGEMDGPPGLVSVARALAYGIGARPLYLAEPLTLPTVVAPSKAAGVPVYDSELIERFGIQRSAAAIPVSLGEQGAQERALDLLDRFRPKALIACEKLAPNAFGEFVAKDGQIPVDVVDSVAPNLFEEARKRGILTIGIGDNGNELGLGVIEDVTNSMRGPNPPLRRGGYGTRVKADVAILATVSNWGAYGISACLAYLLKNMNCLHNEEIEARILEKCAAEGSVDFTAGVPVNHADGKSLEVNQAIITLLRTVVAGRLRERGQSFLPEEFTKALYAWRDYRTSKK